MAQWCDDCKHKSSCKKYKEEMQSPMAKFLLGCLGSYEQMDKEEKKNDRI